MMQRSTKLCTLKLLKKWKPTDDKNFPSKAKKMTLRCLNEIDEEAFRLINIDAPEPLDLPGWEEYLREKEMEKEMKTSKATAVKKEKKEIITSKATAVKKEKNEMKTSKATAQTETETAAAAVNLNDDELFIMKVIIIIIRLGADYRGDSPHGNLLPHFWGPSVPESQNARRALFGLLTSSLGDDDN
jgi:hypothetical protein